MRQSFDCAALCNAFLAGAWEDARSINDRILPLARALLKLDTNPVPVKAALEVLGRDTGALRPPLCCANDAVFGQLRELLAAYDVVPEKVTA